MIDGPLAQLAQLHGIALEYWDQTGGYHEISRETVVGVLAGLGVAVADDQQIAAAIADRELRDWRRPLPPVFVHRQGRESRIWVHSEIAADEAVIAVEDGTGGVATELAEQGPRRDVDGKQVTESWFHIPAGLPLGWHQFQVLTGRRIEYCPLVVVPDRLPDVAPGWGLMVQLYSLRSRQSWGIGDLADLRQLVRWSGAALGADFTLVNPMHASAPVAPSEPSPYLPVTRRFADPMYLRVEDVPEYAELPPADRERVDALAAEVRLSSRTTDLLDRDASWDAKRAACQILWNAGMSLQRGEDFQAFCSREGVGLQDFALWCAMVEEHGRRWREWPQPLQDPRSGEVTQAYAQLEETVTFYAWLQWLLDAQLAAAQEAARAAGMDIGVVHDLAVGVHADGADAWRLGPVLAADVSVGAPPDVYNRLGQDWSQPPWRPDALAEQAFIPYRDMLRTILRNAGGIRVDHILGLYRQWWIPAGMAPAQGTYVRVEHEAMVGILMLEASRVGAVVIGEDLGTVEDWIRADMHDRGILGAGVLWFERSGIGLNLPEHWRTEALASVTVHDLPPTAGYLAGEHVRVRSELGLLTRDLAAEMADHDVEIADWRRVLTERGWLAAGADEPEDVVVALHRLLAASPALLLGVNLPDLTGDIRPQNMPGTHREYPNWRIPLGDATGQPVWLEDLAALTAVRRIAQVVARRSGG